MSTNTSVPTNSLNITLYRFTQRPPILVASTVLLATLLGPFEQWLLTSPALAQTKSPQRRVSKQITSNRQITSRISSKHSWTPRPSQTHWLNHYLLVDRPRIAGGIWKFLSTDTDRRYHRPDSDFMQSQSPDQIIGFASAADAQEAGYLPGPSVNATDRQNGRWFEQGTNATVRVATAPRQGSSRQGSLNFRIPASQIPRDVYVIIQATDILADAIDKAADADTAGAIYRMLRRMRRGSQNYIDLSAVTGNKQAFADATRWYPILEMLEQGATAKMNRGGLAEVNRALSRQSTQMARNNARMLIPQVQAAINRGFTEKVRQEGQRMLRR